MKKPNYIEYRQHLETIAPIMEELRASAPQAIARALIQRGIPNAQGEVKWSVRRVETILKRLAPLTHPKQRSNRLVSYESVAALHEARRKWCLFADRVLRKTFVLSDKNPVFGQSWTADQREKFAKYAVSGQQPIIPLVGSAAAEQELDAWPNGKLDPEVYRTAIRARFRAIAEVETSGQSIRSILGWLGAQSFQFSAADFVIGLMKASLSSANLD